MISSTVLADTAVDAESGAKAVLLIGSRRLGMGQRADLDLRRHRHLARRIRLRHTRSRGGGMSVEWMIIRGSGIAAFAALSAATIWGLLVSSKLLGGWSRQNH